MEETYTGQACRIVFQCLQLLADCLRAALLAKWEEGEAELQELCFSDMLPVVQVAGHQLA